MGEHIFYKNSKTAENLQDINGRLSTMPNDTRFVFPQPKTLDGLIQVSKPCTLFFEDGAENMFVGDIGGIRVNSNDVLIRHPQVRGSGSHTRMPNQIGIAVGDRHNPNLKTKNIRIEDPEIRDFGFGGIIPAYVDFFEVERFKISNIEYAGIMLLSCSNFMVYDGEVSSVGTRHPQGSSENAYGVVATRMTTSDVFISRSKHGIIQKVKCVWIPTWEAYDTHGGEDIIFIMCHAINCSTWMMIGGDGERDAAKNIRIEYCEAEVNHPYITPKHGLAIAGLDVGNAPVEEVKLNSVKLTGFGDPNNSLGAYSIYCRDTRKMSLQNLTVNNGIGSAVFLYYGNNFDIAGLSVNANRPDRFNYDFAVQINNKFRSNSGSIGKILGSTQGVYNKTEENIIIDGHTPLSKPKYIDPPVRPFSDDHPSVSISLPLTGNAIVKDKLIGIRNNLNEVINGIS